MRRLTAHWEDRRLMAEEEWGQRRAELGAMVAERIACKEAEVEEERAALVTQWRRGLAPEGVWFERWRRTSARLKQRKKQKSSKAVLRLQLSSAQQNEATARRQLHVADEAMDAMSERMAVLHSEAEGRTREVTEQQDVIRLQRGFCELRVHQAAKRFASGSTDAQDAASQMEAQLKEQMKHYEALLRQKQRTYDEQVQLRDQVIRTHVSDEIKREIQRDLEKQLKKREKALQDEFRDEITGELEERFESTVSKLRARLKTAEQKAQMYLTRVRGNDAHNTK